jgi:hypothetical protein
VVGKCIPKCQETGQWLNTDERMNGNGGIQSEITIYTTNV